MAAASSPSASFFGIREEQDQQSNMIYQMPTMTPTSSLAAASGSQQPGSSTTAPRRRRNQPGNPNPDAEVIALSPRTLLATNRFVCEVCDKGFQREQNLQLHRRGHNLPWKLRQKSTKEVRRKVYLCPEETCVHHDPSRALGDLTGIKKHYCRKHGEKKWKCDKCSKRYAVQSDWKAHSKTCGTREYRCDCGTLFSRRDSFITHRAFCDAITQENARPHGLNNIGLFTNSNTGLGLSQVNHHHHQLSSLTDQGPSSADLLQSRTSHFEHLIPSNPSSTFTRSPSSAFYLASGSGSSAQDFQAEEAKPFHGMMQHPNTSSAAASFFNLGFFSNGRGRNSSGNNSAGGQDANSDFLVADQFNNVVAVSAGQEQMTLFAGNHLMGSDDHGGLYSTSAHTHEPVLPQMSATALLQKAAQIGASTSSGGRGFTGFTRMAGDNLRVHMENEPSIQDLMNSLANGNAGIFGDAAVGGCGSGGFEGFNPGLAEMNESKLHQNLSMGAASDRLTRDFLGVGSVLRGMGGGLNQREQHVMASSMDSELQSGPSDSALLLPFGGAGSLQ